jgi:hypothetical protein
MPAYRAALAAEMSTEDSRRVAFLAAEDLPDYIGSLVQPSKEVVVKSYKVKGWAKLFGEAVMLFFKTTLVGAFIP